MTALCIVGGVLLIGLILGGLVWQELRQVRRMNASGDVYAALERGERPAVTFCSRTSEGNLLQFELRHRNCHLRQFPDPIQTQLP